MGKELHPKLLEWVRAEPDLTLAEFQTRLRRKAGVALRDAGLASSAQIGLTSEKKSLHAKERETEWNRKRREEFVAYLRMVPLERLILLDETA